MGYSILWTTPEGGGVGCDKDGFPTNTSPPLTNVDDDVALDKGWACDGCEKTDIQHYDISRLEMFDEVEPRYFQYGITTDHVGFITAYRKPDGTYNLVSTLTVGGNSDISG
jgi:hypothetical protein